MKLPLRFAPPDRKLVTPYVGVWIETLEGGKPLSYYRSLLMWECGLKRTVDGTHEKIKRSLLMWECGLKPLFNIGISLFYCHSLCGSVD